MSWLYWLTSFRRKGTPETGVSARGCLAYSRALSKFGMTTALSEGFSFSIALIAASVTSRAETSPRLIAADNPTPSSSAYSPGFMSSSASVVDLFRKRTLAPRDDTPLARSDRAGISRPHAHDNRMFRESVPSKRNLAMHAWAEPGIGRFAGNRATVPIRCLPDGLFPDQNRSARKEARSMPGSRPPSNSARISPVRAARLMPRCWCPNANQQFPIPGAGPITGR